MRRSACLLLLVALALGCARTRYVNLHPQRPPPDHPTATETPVARGWRSFFLYGWVPSSLVLDAREACRGTAHVERIETRQTFLQGLVRSFAGLVVNVYAPYNARVVCDHSEPR